MRPWSPSLYEFATGTAPASMSRDPGDLTAPASRAEHGPERCCGTEAGRCTAQATETVTPSRSPVAVRVIPALRGRSSQAGFKHPARSGHGQR